MYVFTVVLPCSRTYMSVATVYSIIFCQNNNSTMPKATLTLLDSVELLGLVPRLSPLRTGRGWYILSHACIMMLTYKRQQITIFGGHTALQVPCLTLGEYTTPLYTLQFKAAVASSFCAFIYSYTCTYLKWSQAPKYMGRHSMRAHTLLSCVYLMCTLDVTHMRKCTRLSPSISRRAWEPTETRLLQDWSLSLCLWCEVRLLLTSSLHWDSLAISRVADFRCFYKWLSTRVTHFQYMQEFHFSLVVAINLVICLPSLNIETECLGAH